MKGLAELRVAFRMSVEMSTCMQGLAQAAYGSSDIYLCIPCIQCACVSVWNLTRARAEVKRGGAQRPPACILYERRTELDGRCVYRSVWRCGCLLCRSLAALSGAARSSTVPYFF